MRRIARLKCGIILPYPLLANYTASIISALAGLVGLTLVFVYLHKRARCTRNNMMLNGWTSSPIYTKHCYKSPARTLARLIDSKYGRVIDPPQILVH